MRIIGLTGGIGSGKSTVAAMLQDHGIPVVDADEVARKIVAPGQSALAELAKAFGKEIIDQQGHLNRAELARRAFTTSEKTQLLNSITHPAIKAEVKRQFSQLEDAGFKMAIYDMPLLIEQGLHKQMDLTVVVDVDAEERVRRLVDKRGLDESDVRNRIARQIDDETRLAAADIVIDNNGTLENLNTQVHALAARLTELTGLTERN
ncbi:dephospho-CoA kinase [Corynebacterium cystitidis]|uniref:Dephospho-CoA kinase n=1 Tax=Corynebacterium cystitidis DSM 20524 TaxID=1121357 RepID=A0A1H9VCN2_9CORY|nr:dephospho-CoA kinase [Corynebacterium cystitidis]WJY82312.1 Dephospho-CoA kinase [Corynebacterium cystitidis DSM 20524]SES18977.1 dephospho-CoA kinase [Corynebacterium cystitidis DSM 20524]SNV76557.1 dephospho-CoA kinase [Corynebacterium cystitidis]